MDWARATLQNLKQGSSLVDDFITRFLSLVTQAGISNEHGVYLLEQNSKPEIIKQMYIMHQRKANIQDAAVTIREIGRAQELYHIQFGHQGSTWFNNAKQPSASSSGSKVYSGCREPMNIDTAQKGKCFNCTHAMQLQSTKIPALNASGWEGTEQQSALPQTNLVSGMDYEAMKAYFYDMHVNELKAQGKGQGC
ncbi:hypothetical protein BS17DRAFT_821664 [Gyrodon lividus]|nr:hypothetical protein BS17DRAFT_821664 [Gyrodon lividus]